MEGEWQPTEEVIERLWLQIVAQHKAGENYTPEQWKEAHDLFVRCMQSSSKPFVAMQSVS